MTVKDFLFTRLGLRNCTMLATRPFLPLWPCLVGRGRKVVQNRGREDLRMLQGHLWCRKQLICCRIFQVVGVFRVDHFESFFSRLGISGTSVPVLSVKIGSGLCILSKFTSNLLLKRRQRYWRWKGIPTVSAWPELGRILTKILLQHLITGIHLPIRTKTAYPLLWTLIDSIFDAYRCYFPTVCRRRKMKPLDITRNVAKNYRCRWLSLPGSD